MAVSAWIVSAGLYAGMRLYMDTLSPLSANLVFVLGLLLLLMLLWLLIEKGPSFSSSVVHFDIAQGAICVLLGCVLGCMIAFVGIAHYQDEAKSAEGSTVVSLLLLEDVRTTDFGCRAICIASTANGEHVTLSANLPVSCSRMLRGTQLLVTETPISTLAEPDEYSWSRGVVGRVSVFAFRAMKQTGLLRFAADIRSNAIASLEQSGIEGGNLIQALACGYTRGIEDSTTYYDCKSIGLAHLIAVSGSHLVIVVSSLEAVLRIAKVPVFGRAVFNVALTLIYIVFAGMPTSGIRAGIMTTLSLASSLSGRRYSSLSATGVCILLFLALDPKSCVAASLVLSAGSVLGIVLFSDLCMVWLSCLGINQRIVSEPLAMTIASSIVTLPYSVSLFSQLPTISLFANLLAAPLFPPLCVLSLVSSITIVATPVLAVPVLNLAAYSCGLFAVLVSLIAEIPYACIAASCETPLAVAFSLFAAVTLLTRWPTPSKSNCRKTTCVLGLFCFFLAAALVVNMSSYGKEELVALDVGQGDAFLVRSQGSSCLVDTGAQEDLLLKAIARNNVLKLDAVIITHGDDDHCGALHALASVVQIGRILLADDVRLCSCDACSDLLGDAQSLRGSPVVEFLSVGDVIDCGRFALEVVWPERFSDLGGNSDSLCLSALYEAESLSTKGGVLWSALLTGDLEAAQLEEIAKSCKLGPLDILKVGHHGSKNSLNSELAASLQPRIALIGVGEGNRYGHPDQELLSLLKKVGCLVLRTDINGDVRLKFESDRIEISTQRQ